MKAKTIGISLMAVALFSVAVFAVTVQNSPTSCNGSWTKCIRAFADDTLRATGAGNVASGTWQNYGFNVPTGDVIDSVVVRADFFASKTNGYISVRVSGNGGSSYGQAHIVGGNLAEQTFTIPVTGDVAWTPTKLSNANFRVEAKCIKVNSSKSVTCNLDWIPVTVTHHTPVNTTGCGYIGACQTTCGSGYYCAGANPNACGGICEINATCVRANPTVTITPASQSGTPGTKLTYATLVRNNDNVFCGASTFSMSHSIPSGWTGVFNKNSLLIAPGASDTTLFNVTSHANATLGNYTFTNTATNSGAPSFSGTGSAIYRVI